MKWSMRKPPPGGRPMAGPSDGHTQARRTAHSVDEWIPYVVVINAVLGGGDFDDLHYIAIQERLVAYLRSQEEIDFVKAFPRTEVNLTPAWSAKAVEFNRHSAALDANMAKADSKGTYGMRAYYRLLQLKASGGLISKVTNADLDR